MVFLDASTPELVRRYDATRRRHPLADQIRRPRRVDRTRALDARAGPSCRRPRDRHERPQRAPAQGAHRSCLRHVGRLPPPGRRRELRVQARSAARCRHRDGRAVPPQPALGGRPAPAHRTRPEGARLRARNRCRLDLRRPVRRPARDTRAAVPGRGSQLPDGRHRMHRRPPPLGCRRRGTRRAVCASAASPCGPPTATSPADVRWARFRPGMRSMASVQLGSDNVVHPQRQEAPP